MRSKFLEGSRLIWNTKISDGLHGNQDSTKDSSVALSSLKNILKNASTTMRRDLTMEQQEKHVKCGKKSSMDKSKTSLGDSLRENMQKEFSGEFKLKPVLISDEKAKSMFEKIHQTTPLGIFQEGMRLQYLENREVFKLCVDAIKAANQYIALKPYNSDIHGIGDIRDPLYLAVIKIRKAASRLDIK